MERPHVSANKKVISAAAASEKQTRVQKNSISDMVPTSKRSRKAGKNCRPDKGIVTPVKCIITQKDGSIALAKGVVDTRQ